MDIHTEEAMPVALVCSDLHLSEQAPLARCNEPDWFKAQRRVLDELTSAANELDVPIIIAGDLFDRWNPGPPLINFAIDALSHVRHGMYAVPGQHDLPLHSYEDKKKSAYWILNTCGVIKDLPSDRCEIIQTSGGKFVAAGYPWGCPFRKIGSGKSKEERLHVAVVHRFVWVKGTEYTGAKEEQRARAYIDDLQEFDVAIFGDNHKHFQSVLMNERRTLLWNNGTMMRRKIDEFNTRPVYGILHNNGTIVQKEFDTSQDCMIERTSQSVEIIEEASHTMKNFLKELATLEADPLDFRDSLSKYLKKYQVSDGACTIIRKALES